MDKIRVMIVDDLEAHRRRLERAIADEPDIELVQSASSGKEAVLYGNQYHPDIILMDIEMEDKYAGITASRQINHDLPDVKIIILTIYEDDNHIFAAFQTGIVDYLVKTAENAKILEAIRDAYQNLSPIRPIIAEKIRHEFQKVKLQEQNMLYILKLISNLTPSEIVVLRHLYEGKTKRQLSEIRCVEYSTIKKQINSILKKCEQKSTRDLLSLLKEMKIFEVLAKLKSESEGNER